MRKTHLHNSASYKNEFKTTKKSVETKDDIYRRKPEKNGITTISATNHIGHDHIGHRQLQRVTIGLRIARMPCEMRTDQNTNPLLFVINIREHTKRKKIPKYIGYINFSCLIYPRAIVTKARL